MIPYTNQDRAESIIAFLIQLCIYRKSFIIHLLCLIKSIPALQEHSVTDKVFLVAAIIFRQEFQFSFGCLPVKPQLCKGNLFF